MRQLDLFGFAFETPLEKVPEKNQVLPQEEILPAKPAEEEKPYSLVDLAEEVLNIAEEQNGVFKKSSFFHINYTEEKTFVAEGFKYENTTFETGNTLETQTLAIFSEVLETLNEPENIIEALATTEVLERPDEQINKDRKIAESRLITKGLVASENGKIPANIKGKIPAAENIEKIEKAPVIIQKRGRKSFKEIDAEVDLIEIPEDDLLFQKQYYPISEVAKWFKVNTSLLRFWENEFDVLKPKKNRKGDRLFRPEDVKNLELIYQLLRERKYTIEGAKEYIKTNKKKADTQLQLTNTLKKFKGFLLDLKANLQE